MRRNSILLLAVVITAGSALLCVTNASAATKPAVLTCAGKIVVKPSGYVIACADANTYFQNIHWKSWGLKSAAATATLVQNNCIPTCADGKFLKYPATIALSAPRSTKYGMLFSVMNYSYSTSVRWTLPLKKLSDIAH